MATKQFKMKASGKAELEKELDYLKWTLLQAILLAWAQRLQ